MSIRFIIKGLVSSILQKRKSVKQFRRTVSFVQAELKTISQLPESGIQKSGTLIVKCDDIGDFLVWQQVIDIIRSNDSGPVYFVGNKVLKSIYDAYFDFADKVIWIDKSKWTDETYRLEQYGKVRELNPERAVSALFTRNFNLDDLIVQASGANEKIAWHRRHHAYFPEFDVLDYYFTRYISSEEPVMLEYFRNIEMFSRIYGIPFVKQFKVLFPNFKKYSTLVIVPVASAGSKTWKAANFADVIRQVIARFDRIILLGGKNGVEIAAEIVSSVKDPKIINLVDQTKLNELFAFIGEARLLLSLDTFAAHMGPLCGTDTIVIANGTNWQRFGDYEGKVPSKFNLILPPDFKPEFDRIKINYNSSEIQTIPVELVVKSINRMLDQK